MQSPSALFSSGRFSKKQRGLLLFSPRECDTVCIRRSIGAAESPSRDGRGTNNTKSVDFLGPSCNPAVQCRAMYDLSGGVGEYECKKCVQKRVEIRETTVYDFCTIYNTLDMIVSYSRDSSVVERRNISRARARAPVTRANEYALFFSPQSAADFASLRRILYTGELQSYHRNPRNYACTYMYPDSNPSESIVRGVCMLYMVERFRRRFSKTFSMLLVNLIVT